MTIGGQVGAFCGSFVGAGVEDGDFVGKAVVDGALVGAGVEDGSVTGGGKGEGTDGATGGCVGKKIGGVEVVAGDDVGLAADDGVGDTVGLAAGRLDGEGVCGGVGLGGSCRQSHAVWVRACVIPLRKR